MFRPTAKSIAQFEQLRADQQIEQVMVVQQCLVANRAISFARLHPAKTAKTLRIKGTKPPLVTDGPFIEAKKSIGGFSLLEADSTDEAVKKAQSWPPSDDVEVRSALEPSPGAESI
jgi:hypothetical protein